MSLEKIEQNISDLKKRIEFRKAINNDVIKFDSDLSKDYYDLAVLGTLLSFQKPSQQS